MSEPDFVNPMLITATELDRLQHADAILQKLAVFCDFREMQGACEFTEAEMAYLAAAGALQEETP